MSHRPFKNKLYAEFARVGNALASEKRLELMDLLAQGPRYVDALASEMEMSVANISQHLQVLRNAKLVESEREGTRVRYRLMDKATLRLWLNLRDVAEEHLPEIRQLRRQYSIEGLDDELPRERLFDLLASNEALLLDVRPVVEYQHGHIAGAVHVSLEDLLLQLESFPKDKKIVAYCRGEYCLFADEAVSVLRANGFDAVRLEGGWPEWLLEGRDTE
jgi:rhodanese-related sulfurtransferase